VIQVIKSLQDPLKIKAKFGTSQGAVLPCSWEGNRRSVVALAMHFRLQWFIHPRLVAQEREMSTLSTFLRRYDTLTLLTIGGSVAEWLACWTQAQ